MNMMYKVIENNFLNLLMERFNIIIGANMISKEGKEKNSNPLITFSFRTIPPASNVCIFIFKSPTPPPHTLPVHFADQWVGCAPPQPHHPQPHPPHAAPISPNAWGKRV